MASVESISAAIESVAAKKENLRKAFEDLRSQPATLPSFAFCWKDLEDYFDSMEKSIHQSFEDLKFKEHRKQQLLQPTIESLPSHKEKSLEKDPANEPEKLEQDRLPELKSRSVEMDRKEFWSFFAKSSNDLMNIRDQITAALQSVPDPAELVLDAMEEFSIPPNSNFFLHELRLISPEIKAHVKEKALKVAVEAKGQVLKGGKKTKRARTFLNFVSTYGLGSAFDADELLDFVILVTQWVAHSINLCRDLGLSKKIPDLVHRLTSMGRLLEAVKFICAFELTDKFPPASLLKKFLQDAEKCTQEIREKGNNSIQAQNLATKKELFATKAVIKTIDELKLESEYPCEPLLKRIVELEKLMEAVPKPHQQPAIVHGAEGKDKSKMEEATSKPLQHLAIKPESDGEHTSKMEEAVVPKPQQQPAINQKTDVKCTATIVAPKPQQPPAIELKADGLHAVIKQRARRGKRGGRKHAAKMEGLRPQQEPASKRPRPTAATDSSFPMMTLGNPPAMQVGGAQPYLRSAGTYGLVGPSNGPSILAASGQLGPPMHLQHLMQSSLYNNPIVHPSSGHLPPPQPYHPSYYP
ncbi:FRIGIDA-like protein 1 [Magnolia sinica]|uniref:FRIGIDA-like protein 1 n=1 Tax=Magnolia sinica TaxID=86752 RepID=UPI00265A2B73|nr:FRIGIDA-like protein 1 [Magnolia sinica]